MLRLTSSACGVQGQARRGLKRGRCAADNEAEEEDVDEEEAGAELVTQKQITDMTRSLSSLARVVKAVVAQPDTVLSGEHSSFAAFTLFYGLHNCQRGKSDADSRTRPDLVL